MRGKKGARLEWSTYWRSRESKWVIKYYGATGGRAEERIPREEAPTDADKPLADAYAARWYAAFKREVRLAPERVPAPPAGASPVLADFADRWLGLRKQVVATGKIKGATYKQDKTGWNEHIKPVLGNAKLTQLTTGVLRPFVRALAEKKAPLTVHNIVSVLTVMLDDIIAEEWFPLEMNPARHPKVREVLPPRSKRAGKHVVIFIDQPQVETLLRCKYVPPRRKLRYLVGLLSGLRDGELAGLRIEDVVDANGVAALNVDKAYALVGKDGKKQLQAPKNENSVRTVPLHPLALEVLRWWMREGWAEYVGRKPSASDALFPDEKGRPYRPRSAESLRVDLARAGLPTTFRGHNIVFHSMRASFCTYLEESDASAPIKSRLLGQGAANVADAHYTSKSFARLRAAVESLNLNVTLKEITTYERPPRTSRGKSASSNLHANVALGGRGASVPLDRGQDAVRPSALPRSAP